ncbi:M14 family metallopeptidase [Lacrimispora sp.]|uniref:M14 family metallopeptidase n=1 Tax=Lacrimispora sp. TaxID=2719234 RepID=UPI0039912706
MRKEAVFTLSNLYRDDMNIYGYHFGKGDKSACIIGACRGNEIQQLYICSQLIRQLKDLEERGAIVKGKEILVIPTMNTSSINLGKRFWSADDSDINRSFPGDMEGETTKRIAAGIFHAVKEYSYGIQFTSFYIPGNFIPHVRMMDTGRQNPSLANLFGLPYVVIREAKPIDKVTLNYNWQLNNTNAFSIYTSGTDKIDEPSAKMAVASVLRFLTRMGMIRYTSHSGYIASVLREHDLASVRTDCAGIYRPHFEPGQEVRRGDVLAEIFDPMEGEIISQILAPAEGIVFFAHAQPLVMEGAIIYKIIRRLHQ